MVVAAPGFRTLQAPRQFGAGPWSISGGAGPLPPLGSLHTSGGSNSNLAPYSRAGQIAV